MLSKCPHCWEYRLPIRRSVGLALGRPKDRKFDCPVCGAKLRFGGFWFGLSFNATLVLQIPIILLAAYIVALIAGDRLSPMFFILAMILVAALLLLSLLALTAILFGRLILVELPWRKAGPDP